MAIVFNLDKLLASRKMQSVELAEKLECTVQTVSRIKNGKIRALRIDSLDRICEVFDCQPGDLLEYLSDEEAEKRYGETFLEEYKNDGHWNSPAPIFYVQNRLPFRSTAYHRFLSKY